MATANSGSLRREPGDWPCQQCHEINFKSRNACRRCSTARNQSIQTNTAATPLNAPRQGDWNCGHCNIMNFASRNACFKCGRQRQEVTRSNNPPAPVTKSGDWICQVCQNNNFAARIACHKCGRSRSVPVEIDAPAQATVKPGDWKCPSCPEMNFGSRVVCRSCGAARPSTDDKNKSNTGECVICMDKPIDSVITTCGHSTVCLDCGKSITECPICRNPFNEQQLIRFYNVH